MASSRWRELLFLAVVTFLTVSTAAQSSSASHASKTLAGKPHSDSPLDRGSVSNSVYRNKTFAFTCKVPEGWVLRTDEMNARDESGTATQTADSSKPGTAAASSTGSAVLLAAFSRPPEAKGEDVNSSVLIAAESASAYPGLKDAVQYLDPLTEVAKAQGFIVDEDPYEIAIEAQKLVRSDFHKDVGTRVMRQSTLAMISHGYAVSFTVIGGTDDEVEDLIDSLDFGSTKAK